jgi:hypothetical protein
MRYDPEVRASNCYLEFLRCSRAILVLGSESDRGLQGYRARRLCIGLHRPGHSSITITHLLLHRFGRWVRVIPLMRRTTSEILSQRLSLPTKVDSTGLGFYFFLAL